VGVGLWTIDQVDPFHDSTSVCVPLDVEEPTAVHIAGPEHETANSRLTDDPGTFGLAMTDQAVPFHDSTSVWLAEPFAL
jgi:hypothetical protein